MQLSNEPAEELAHYLIGASKGAFELVGFVSGGEFVFQVLSSQDGEPNALSHTRF